VEWIWNLLSTGLSAAGLGLNIRQALRSSVKHPLSQPEERALVGAFWQLVSFRVAFSSILELLERNDLLSTSPTLRPDATERQLLAGRTASDEYKRYQDYYKDTQSHLERLSRELRVARPDQFVEGTDDAYTAEKLREIEALVMRLRSKDMPLTSAIDQVGGLLSEVHGNVERMMRQRFKSNHFGSGAPARTPADGIQDLGQVQARQGASPSFEGEAMRVLHSRPAANNPRRGPGSRPGLTGD
jgi:hypothetical protein